MFAKYFLTAILLLTTPIFGIDLPSDVSIKDEISDVEFNLYVLSMDLSNKCIIASTNTYKAFKLIANALTNEEREQIYKEAIEQIETFKIDDSFRYLQKENGFPNEEEIQNTRENLKAKLTNQLQLYNTYPRWLLNIGKFLGIVPSIL